MHIIQGYISHGVGTIMEVMEGTQEGTCLVIWDSDECHTRHLHSKLSNLHSAKVRKFSVCTHLWFAVCGPTCVCMYMHVHVCMWYIYIYIYIYTFVYMGVYLHMCAHISYIREFTHV
jgi:hypothetical protein